jgi:hypothetical protein
MENTAALPAAPAIEEFRCAHVVMVVPTSESSCRKIVEVLGPCLLMAAVVIIVLFPAAALIAESRDTQVLMVAVVLMVVEDSKDDVAIGAASPAVHTGASRISRKKSQRTFESIHDQQLGRDGELIAIVHAWLNAVNAADVLTAFEKAAPPTAASSASAVK